MKFFIKTEVRIFLIFWVIFSVFAASDRWNDNASLDLTMAIVDEHRFEIDSYFNNTGDRTYYNGHYYSDKVPGAAFLTVPLYKVYKLFVGGIPYHDSLDEDNPSWKYHLFLFLAISLISAVCGALTIVLVYKISRYFTSNDLHRNLVIIVLGLGTLLPHAGRQFNSHAISTFFIFFCFYLIFKMKKEKIDNSLTAGMAGGFAILSEYRTIIILFGLFIIILTIKKWRYVLKFVIGVLIFYSILLLYYHAIYDSPFRNPMEHFDRQIWLSKMCDISCDDERSKKIQTAQGRDFASTTPMAIIKHLILRSDIKIAMRLLFDPFKGLIFYSPVMLFSFLGLFLMYKKYMTETLIIFFCFIIFIFHLSSFLMWWMGLSFGPRHLTVFIPFLMIPLLYIFKKLNKNMILFLIIISILINLIGMQSVYLSHDPVVDSKAYCERMKSFVPLANPLFSNYIPSLLNYNPRTLQDSLVLERLLGFKMIPFACTFLLLVTFLLVWKNKIIFKSKRN